MEKPEKFIELKSQTLCTHVKAVKFVLEFLFVGEGNLIQCYNWRTKERLASERAFQISTVHGIHINDAGQNNIQLLVFGGKSIRTYNFSVDHKFRNLTDEHVLEDWIHDVQCLVYPTIDHGTKNIAAFVLAHNSLLLWDMDLSVVYKKFSCLEKCILYSAKILSCSPIIVASGTVFNEIVIWSPDSNCEGEKKVPIHCLKGHKGVIFSITFDTSLRQLCSTSDDRSLRLWQFCSPEAYSEGQILEFEGWKNGYFDLLHVLFAHECRVWKSVILPNCIISVGEDSAVCFWRHDGSLIRKEKGHNGGSIWCIDVNIDNNIAVTGGSDSGLSMWNVKQLMKSDTLTKLFVESEVELEDDFPRNVAFLSTKYNQFVVTTTDKGYFLAYDLSMKYKVFSHFDASMASYCVLSVSPKSDFVLLGNLHGEIVLFNVDGDEKCSFTLCKKEKLCDGKINNIHWVDSNAFLICGQSGKMQLFLMRRQAAALDFAISGTCKLFLPKSKPHWWSTIAIHLKTDSLLCVGDRGGSIHLYQPINGNVTDYAPPMETLFYIHGKNGVMDLKEKGNFLYSTGRDGRLLVYDILPGSIHLLHSMKVSCDLEWMSHIIFNKDDLILLGFHSTDFIAWSTQQRKILMRVNCGGGHRSWDFSLSSIGKGAFVTIIRKEIFLAYEECISDSVIQKGISGMAFCCICFICTKKDEKLGKLSIFFCGGENPSVSIIGLRDNTDSSRFTMLHSMSGHLSSVRAISKCQILKDYKYLVVSVGGRAQMMIWKVSLENEILCEELATDFLWNLDKPSRKPWKDKYVQIFDPQTRYMDVAIWPGHEDSEFFIATACSDSYIRLHTFSTLDQKLRHCLTLHHGDHCVFKLSPFTKKNENSSISYLATAASDGNVKIYNSLSLYSALKGENCKWANGITSVDPVLTKRLHQSGINALDVKHIGDCNWLLMSGGDDNSLSVMHLFLDPCCNVNAQALSVVTNYHAHSSQITGVAFLCNDLLLSTSIDQRLNVWQRTKCDDDDKVNVQLVESKMSFVPDIAHLSVHLNECHNSWTVVLGGQGLESFNVKITHS